MKDPRLKTIPPSLVRTDGDTQLHAEGTDEATVREYAAAMARGDEFPPITVYLDEDHRNWLADGFKTLAAHKINAAAHKARPGQYNPWAKIRAIIIPGTRRQAILHAAGANATHGQPRSNATKRNQVMTLLMDKEWGKWSDNQIAQKCKVSQPFVSNLRKASTNNVISEKSSATGDTPSVIYQNKHGQQATMNTAAIGRKADPPGRPEPAPATPAHEPVITAPAPAAAKLPPEVAQELSALLATLDGMAKDIPPRKKAEYRTSLDKLRGHLQLLLPFD